MGSIFRMDSPLMRGLSRLADLMMLNVLAVVCSLPVVTLGASASALYYAVGHLQQEEGTPLRDFFKSFRQNFVQATILWLILLVSGVALVFAMLYYLSAQLTGGAVLLMLTCLVSLIWGLVFTWAFPLQAKFVNTVRGTLNNALLLSVAYLPRTFAAMVLNAVPVLVFLFLPQIFVMGGIVWLALWFALATSFNLRILKKPLDKMIESAGGADPEQE